jgi:type VI secretion system protein ImpA
MFTLEKLLAPLGKEQPCGIDITFSSELDAVARARRTDGGRDGEHKESDWHFVAGRCAQLITMRSKHLKLAVWMAEAGALTTRLRGLGDGLLVVAGLCERYWDGVYPLPDENGCEQRIGHLCWIAARTPQLIAAIAAGTRQSAAPGQTRLDHEKFLLDACHCMGAITELERVIDERLGAAGPSLSEAHKAMDRVLQASTVAARTRPADPGAAFHGQTREQAVAQLRQAAAFFLRTEPDSPVAYLAEKAASWGEQPLHVWVQGIVKEPAAFAQLARLLDLGGAARHD